ncbi:MAG: hypothetical protein ACYC28_09615 [Longimicrobiales bacterium]
MILSIGTSPSEPEDVYVVSGTFDGKRAARPAVMPLPTMDLRAGDRLDVVLTWRDQPMLTTDALLTMDTRVGG